MKTLFVTGIGTDVGKTVVSAILTEAWQADYWKPVQAGNFYGTDALTVKDLVSNKKTVIHPEIYSFKQALSPHAAAELENVTIDPEKIRLPDTDNTLIIEGAGGLLVPLNSNFFIIDLIRKFNCEVILVVQNYVGSINHSLLSIDALNKHGIPVKGLIFNGPPHKMSEEIILSYSGLPALGFISKEREINRETISRYAEQFASIPL